MTVDGEYQELTPTAENWLWSQQLGLYLGIHQRKLRFFTPEGQLIPLPEEDANQQLEQTNLQLEQTNQQLQQERLRNQQLIQRLRVAGIDPDEVR